MTRHYLILLLLLLVLWSVESSLITRRAQLSSKRDGVGGIQVADRYYFVGGFEFSGLAPTNIIEIYNIASSAWEEPLFLEDARGFVSTAVYDQNIYFVGGYRQTACAMLYNADQHQYEDIGCGPTARNAIQISYHNDTLTVLGSFSADFYNASKQWSYIPKLTSWMQQISGGVKLVHENLVIGIGGVNTTTSEQLYDAWIFDTMTNELTIFKDVTTATSSDNLASLTFTAANDWIVIYGADRYFLHKFGTNQWQESFMTGIYDAVLLGDYMFLFNTTGSMIYNLSTMEQTFRSGKIEKVFVLETQVVLYSTDGGRYLYVYENGQITTIELTFPIDLAVRWGDKYAFHAEGYYLRIYDPLTKTVSNLSPIISNVQTIVPFNNTTLVFFIQSSESLIYDLDTDQTNRTLIGLSNPRLIGTDIVSTSSYISWINLNETATLNLTVNSLLIDGPVIYGPILRDYMYIDVLNYVTRQWQQRIPMNSVFSNTNFAFTPVLVIDDLLILGRRQQTLRYNMTTGTMNVTASATINALWNFFPTVTNAAVVNHTGYLPGRTASVLVAVNSTTEVLNDYLQLDGIPKQFVTFNNVIYSTILSSGIFYSINTLDFLNGLVGTIILPSPQISVCLAVMDNTLIALGNDGSVYGLLLNDRLTWYKTPLQNDFVRTLTVAMKDGTFMVAGGKHSTFLSYTDEILFINASAVIEMGTRISINEPVTTTQPSSTVPLGSGTGLSEGELAAAIVVPVVVVIGGVIALVIILVKRRKAKKNNPSTTFGLEARYGTWFIPFNQITFGEQLGQGSSGQVFKGTWNNTTVALKVSMAQANSSVIAELELMIQLRPHPNVVQLLGFSVHPETDSIILVIEFCEGRSLDAKLYDAVGDIPQQTKVQWLIGIAKGLSHLHSNNIVHRDVAARNILMDRNEPKVTDFGMSRLMGEQQQHGTTKSELGPIRWMSPESLRSKEYSTKSDIWSFGILMFEVIAQQEPHSDADPIEIGRLIRDSGLTPVMPPTSECHPQLAEIMKQCWQMSPQSRPKIETIVQMLESVVAE